ncbi:hypothetical protein ABZ281_19125 [Streptomyces sp. NPDC006265]
MRQTRNTVHTRAGRLSTHLTPLHPQGTVMAHLHKQFDDLLT